MPVKPITTILQGEAVAISFSDATGTTRKTFEVNVGGSGFHIYFHWMSKHQRYAVTIARMGFGLGQIPLRDGANRIFRNAFPDGRDLLVVVGARTPDTAGIPDNLANHFGMMLSSGVFN